MEEPSVYKGSVTDVLNDYLDRRPRGTASRLAEVLGVDRQQVSRWRKGARFDPEYWPKTEAVLDIPGGTFARAAGVVPDDDELPDVVALRRSLAFLQARARGEGFAPGGDQPAVLVTQDQVAAMISVFELAIAELEGAPPTELALAAEHGRTDEAVDQVVEDADAAFEGRRPKRRR